jgi:hypothetical protein
VIADDRAEAVPVGGRVDEVVGHDEVAWVEQVVEAADARVGEDPPDAGPVQHAEDLARGAPARDAGPPAVHPYVERAGAVELEEGERRAVAPRCLHHELALEHADGRVEALGEGRRVRAGAPDDRPRRLEDAGDHLRTPRARRPRARP